MAEQKAVPLVLQQSLTVSWLTPQADDSPLQSVRPPAGKVNINVATVGDRVVLTFNPPVAQLQLQIGPVLELIGLLQQAVRAATIAGGGEKPLLTIPKLDLEPHPVTYRHRRRRQ